MIILMNEFIAFLSINGDEYALTEVLETEDAISERLKLLYGKRKVTDILLLPIILINSERVL